MRRRVLMAHPHVGIVGGGNAVAAWALEALREEFEVTLATLGPVDHEALNRSFGTSLQERDFAIRIASRSYLALLRCVPTSGAQMEIALTTRWVRELDARERFDVLLSTQNEMDFGRAGLQYVHYPWAYLPRPDGEVRWFHQVPGVLASYRGLCQRIAGGTVQGSRVNLSLANSQFVADRIKQVYGVDAEILHPPVPGNYPGIPWEQRRSAAVAIGRMHHIKRWELAVEIVDLVRSRGIDLGLTLINQPDAVEYGRRITAMAASRPWFRILTGLTREQLTQEVAQHRYGIHTMEEEHFGIAVAEILRGGCVPFVHDSGGPVEIVGGQRELRFRTAEEGAGALAAVIADAALRDRLRSVLAAQRERFSAEMFCDSLQRVVRKHCE
jgi:glycosyltransferase involved in cell wall biosynthesis